MILGRHAFRWMLKNEFIHKKEIIVYMGHSFRVVGLYEYYTKSILEDHFKPFHQTDPGTNIHVL